MEDAVPGFIFYTGTRPSVVDVPTAKRALAALARDVCVSGASRGWEDERNEFSGVSENGVTGVPVEQDSEGEMANHRDVVDSAAAAVADLGSAAAFVETVGLDRLRRAVECVPDRETRRRGQCALAAFERFRRAAADERGETQEERSVTDDEQFHRGRGTDLRGDCQRGNT